MIAMDTLFEEDRRENLRICLALAPQYCEACHDFHLATAVRRSVPGEEKSGLDVDRQDFIHLVAEALRLRQRWADPLTVLIAGAADTAILKLVLDAALGIGGESFARRVHVTIVDLCETPLEMCRAYATRHGLEITTHRSDIGRYQPEQQYGLVAMHGVLPFFPVDQRLDYMKQVVTWLDARGLVVSSSQIGENSPQREDIDTEIAGRSAMLERFLSTEACDVSIDLDAMLSRLRKAVVARSGYPRVFDDEAALRSFYARAGLSLLDYRSVTVSHASSRYAQRAVVLGSVA